MVRPGPGGLDLGSKRLTRTLDALCGDDLPEKEDALTTETTALLFVVAAVVLYFLFFHGRSGRAVAPVAPAMTEADLVEMERAEHESD